jgi:hypothetical protein
MVSLRRGALVWLCSVVLASACARHSKSPATNEPPRAQAAWKGGTVRWSPRTETTPQTPSPLGNNRSAWPAAQDVTGQNRAAPPAEYDTYTPTAAPRRPGLATRYAERRESSMTEVPFQRAHPKRPSAVLALLYDDESGVEWKTGRDAHDATPSVFSMHGGAVEVSVVSSWDNPLPHLSSNGRMFIIGDASDRYAIRLVNRSRKRYEVVASVDGLDVISGTEATLGHAGHVLAPWSSLRIEGFREGMDAVRAFRFGEPEESYAVGRGFGRDLGVIGVALFDEHSYRNSIAEPNPFPGRFAPPPH